MAVIAPERSMTLTTFDTIDLRVPADPAYLAVMRTATAGLAARLDLTLDDIEDLRIAVDEACVLLIGGRRHDNADLHATFTVSDTLEVLITGPASLTNTVDSLAWSVLQAMAGRVDTGRTATGSWIRLTQGPALP